VRSVVAVANQKGGVGKTNLAGNIAAELASEGRRVVAIDLDPQATLTTWAIGRANPLGTAEVLLGESPIASVVVEAPAFGFQLLASVPDRMRLVERQLASEFSSERRLERALRGYEADVVVIDCPPSMGILTASALAAADLVLVPTTATIEGIDGLAQFKTNLAKLVEAFERPIPMRVVATIVDARTRLAREALDAIRALVGNDLAQTVIRESVALREAVGYQQPIRTYRPGSTGADDYRSLAHEVFANV
jgi:chromosome partitioning protein